MSKPIHPATFYITPQHREQLAKQVENHTNIKNTGTMKLTKDTPPSKG